MSRSFWELSASGLAMECLAEGVFLEGAFCLEFFNGFVIFGTEWQQTECLAHPAARILTNHSKNYSDFWPEEGGRGVELCHSK